MAIYQGSNDSIILPFDRDVSDANDISVGVYKHGKCERQWHKDDLVFLENNNAEVPLRQEDTAALNAGTYDVLVKVLDEDGNIILYDRFGIMIGDRADRGVILKYTNGDLPDTSENGTTVSTLNGIENTIRYRYTSPKIGDDNYWYEYNIETGAFVNTGILAKGQKGDPGEITYIENAYDDTSVKSRLDSAEASINNLGNKQDKIDDLSAIRSGAALGATALQSFTETDPTVPAWAKAETKPTYTASEIGAAESVHTHVVSDVVGLQDELDAKVDNDDSRLTDARVPVAHTHDTADVTGLQDALNAKQDVVVDIDAIRSGAALGATALQSFTETDPTVPDWAKQPNKPSYTPTEVGALPSDTFIPTKMSDLTQDVETGKIDSISVNGTEQTIVNKNVNVTVPTKVSDLTNDSGYLTQHQDITGKVDKEDIEYVVYYEDDDEEEDTEDAVTLEEFNEYKALLEEKYPFGIEVHSIETILENVECTFTKDIDKNGNENDFYVSQDIATKNILVGGRRVSQRYILKVNDVSYPLIEDYRGCQAFADYGGWYDMYFIGDCSIFGYTAREASDEIGYCLCYRYHKNTITNLYSKTQDSVTISLYKVNATVNRMPYDLLPERFPRLISGEAAGIMVEYGGKNNTGNTSFAEGVGNIASGEVAHAEGTRCTASGMFTHAEGYITNAKGNTSHAEGQCTITTETAKMGHVEGNYTISSGRVQHVEGQYNIEDTSDVNTEYGAGARKYLHIVGNGKSEETRSNAHTLDWNGNAWYAGTVEGTSAIIKSPDGSRWQLSVDNDGVLTTTKLGV